MNRKLFGEILDKADIRLNGDRPWDLQMRDQRMIESVLASGSLGFGEAYMRGWWECEHLDQLIERVLLHRIDAEFSRRPTVILDTLRARLFNLQAVKRAFRVGEQHYDIGNSLYQAMLDAEMNYTCGYWREAQDLGQAQRAKLDLVCRKLGLGAGDRLLDIGCGWGALARHAARHYGCEVVGITISKKQAELAREMCSGLPIEIRLQDYREVDEPFDHIASLGMFEHVGVKNYHTYMRTVARNLREGGLFLLHTIGSLQSVVTADPWITRYIFPNSMLPSMKQISTATEGVLVMEDWHNFGTDYDLTLMSWFHNFDAAWPRLKHDYDDTFYRMWKYYLLSCAGAFRVNAMQLWQMVFSKTGTRGGYTAIR